jgi:hypothetical protein
MATTAHQTGCLDQCTPVRNRYFYGKMLDVFHFELEQNYFNTKRWLLNRLVTGYGVVCGLNVLLTADAKGIYVTPGLAIDKCGHEIILCQSSATVPLPQPPPPAPTAPPTATAAAPAGGRATPAAGAPPAPPSPPAATSGGSGPSAAGTENCDCGQYYHLLLCYHECPTDPSPTLGGDCDTQTPCSPGAIRERYLLQLADDKLAPARTTSSIADVINGGAINYQALANYVANIAPDEPCPDCCIPLANIRVPDPGKAYDQNQNIDISVRPIVYTNDLLYEMILAMKQGAASTSPKKP